MKNDSHAMPAITQLPLMTWLRLTVLQVMLFAAGLSQAQILSDGYEEPEFLPVEEAYRVNILDLGDRQVVNWQIADGYFLYKHAFRFKANGEPINAEIISEGKDKVDDYFGEVTVYYNFVDAEVKQAQPPQRLTVVSQGCADAGLCYPPRTQYFQRQADDSWLETEKPTATSIPASSPNAVEQTTNAPQQTESQSLWLLIGFAFLGGLILNLMPCVLPVLTLKALSFVKDSNSKQRIAQGWAYTAGVIISFVSLAAVIIGLKAAGQAAGWGFQLQSPVTIAALIYLFLLIGLNLLGAFYLHGPALNGGDNSKSNLANAFFTGVLAVVVASPCTAPFMGTAVGASLTLPAAHSLTVFCALGLGMAAPFLLISYLPQSAKWLPKPGQWMNTLKEALAFPMFATAAWLMTVAFGQTSETGALVILLICVAIGLVLWIKKQQSFATLLAILVAAVTLSYFTVTPKVSDTQREFSLEALDTLIETGDTVFVNVTASWCITCKVNERVALRTDTTQAALSQPNVHYVIADWSNYNEDIAQLLDRHNRNGIPLYLIYRNGDVAQPQILPQVLTPSAVASGLATP